LYFDEEMLQNPCPIPNSPLKILALTFFSGFQDVIIEDFKNILSLIQDSARNLTNFKLNLLGYVAPYLSILAKELELSTYHLTKLQSLTVTMSHNCQDDGKLIDQPTGGLRLTGNLYRLQELQLSTCGLQLNRQAALPAIFTQYSCLLDLQSLTIANRYDADFTDLIKVNEAIKDLRNLRKLQIHLSFANTDFKWIQPKILLCSLANISQLTELSLKLGATERGNHPATKLQLKYLVDSLNHSLSCLFALKRLFVDFFFGGESYSGDSLLKTLTHCRELYEVEIHGPFSYSFPVLKVFIKKCKYIEDARIEISRDTWELFWASLKNPAESKSLHKQVGYNWKELKISKL
jgi:hypothetical protein